MVGFKFFNDQGFSSSSSDVHANKYAVARYVLLLSFLTEYSRAYPRMNVFHRFLL